jgi:hypothetical protein
MSHHSYNFIQHEYSEKFFNRFIFNEELDTSSYQSAYYKKEVNSHLHANLLMLTCILILEFS